MAYSFIDRPFEWTNDQGATPTTEEIALGLQGGMALPANFVNQQWTATYKAIAELQDIIETGAVFQLIDTMVVDESFEVFGEFSAGTNTFDTTQTDPNTNFKAALGFGNTAGILNLAVGKYCKTPAQASCNATTGDLFIVGNGLGNPSVTMRSNAFRVTAAGEVMGTQAYSASGADFAECFEWTDGNPDNEDRRGRFVTLEGEKIRLATAEDDYILGAVSSTPSVIGDSHTDDWQGKYERDVFGARVLENGAWKLSEGFNEEEDTTYTSRLKRPEWAAVGLVGKLVIVDDGTCEVNGYCKPSNCGIATASESGYRVMSRIDETHVKVLVK